MRRLLAAANHSLEESVENPVQMQRSRRIKQTEEFQARIQVQLKLMAEASYVVAHTFIFQLFLLYAQV